MPLTLPEQDGGVLTDGMGGDLPRLVGLGVDNFLADMVPSIPENISILP